MTPHNTLREEKAKERKKEYDRLYARDYYKANKVDKLAKNEAYRKLNWQRLRKAAYERMKRNPELAAAYQAVSTAVKKGTLLKQPCFVCAEPKSQFHHTDGYEVANQLIGRWLCNLHHKEAHGWAGRIK